MQLTKTQILAINEILTAKVAPIKRASVGNYAKADVTGMNEWMVGEIHDADEKYIYFTTPDGEEVTIGRAHCSKATRADYDAVAELLEVEEDESQNEPEGEAEEEDDEDAGSIVKDGYKKAYRDRGNVNHCGDWLAKQLEGQFVTVGGLFDPESFLACLAENGVDTSTGKWCDLSKLEVKGFTGRLRMNGRQKLEIMVFKNRGLTLRGKYCPIPDDFLRELSRRHPKIAAEIDEAIR